MISIISFAGRQRYPILRDHPRAAVRPLYQHHAEPRPSTRHRDVTETRLRRVDLWNYTILSIKQQRFLPSHSLCRAEEVRALSGGPLSGHGLRCSGHHGRRVVAWRQRGSSHGAYEWTGCSNQKGRFLASLNERGSREHKAYTIPHNSTEYPLVYVVFQNITFVVGILDGLF